MGARTFFGRWLTPRFRRRQISSTKARNRRLIYGTCWEQLEDRRLLAVLDVGPLRFDGPFEYNAAFGTNAANGLTLVGLKPVQGEPFKSLVAVNGTVTIYDATPEQFFVSGSLSLFVLSDPGTTTEIWYSQDGQFFEANELVESPGQQLIPSDDELPIDLIKVVEVPFVTKTLLLDNPQGGSTEDARVGLQGELDFAVLGGTIGLPGLTVGVSGDDYVWEDENGQILTGVEATVNKNFTVAGVGVSGSMGVSYSAANEEFGFVGAVKLNTPGGGLKDFAVHIEELTVLGGDVTAVEFSLDGTINGNTIYDLQIKPENLTFDLDLEEGFFKMWGKLSVAVKEDGESRESIVADLGTEEEPGLVTDFSGHVTEVNMCLSGSFALFGLKMEIPGTNPVTLKYRAGDEGKEQGGDEPVDTGSTYEISGTLKVPALFKATVSFGTESQPGLIIHDGAWAVDGVSFAVSDVPLGGFKLRQLFVSYAKGPDPNNPEVTQTTFKARVAVEFPSRWEVLGQIIFVDGEIHEIEVQYEALSESTRIPVGDTGLFVTEIDVTLQNLDNPQSIIATGHFEAEYGESVTIFGEKSTILRVEGEVVIDADHLLLDASVWVGAQVKDGKTTSILGSGHGELFLDWHNQDYSLDVSGSMLDGVFTFDVGFKLNSSHQLWVAADASVNVPHGVPLIGGQHIGSMDFRLAHDPSDSSKSYVLAWITLNLLVTKVEAGLEYRFDKKEWIAVGDSTINALKKDPFDQDQITVYSAEFDVPAGATSATLSVNFPKNSGTQSYGIIPAGSSTEIKDSDFNTTENGITPLTDLNTATSYNVSIVNTAGENEPLPEGSYVFKMYSTNYKFADPTLNIASILNDGNGFAQISFADQAKGIKVGNIITISDTSLPDYNVDHVVNSVSADGRTIVTDQLYVSQATLGTGKDWSQPHFSSTFYNLAPTLSLGDIPASLDGSSLSVSLSGSVDKVFASATTVDVYLDRNNAGYNGVPLQRTVPLKFAKDSEGQLTGAFTADAVADIADLTTGTYYVYAVIKDGTNAPVHSAYSNGFVLQHPVQGTIANQLGDPQSGWQVFADLNHNGIQEADEPISRSSNSDGQFVFAKDTSPLATVSIFTDPSAPNPPAYVYFPTPNHNVKPGDELLLTGSSIADYNTTFRVTDVFPGQVFVLTDQAWVGNGMGINASLVYQSSPLPPIQSIFAGSGTSPAPVIAAFSSPHQLQVGDRFLVSKSAVSSYNTIHTVAKVLSATQVQTDQTYNGSASNLKASTLAKSIPVNTPFDAVLVNPYPDSFAFGADGGTVSGVRYDGMLPTSVNFSVDEFAVIRGSVFADLEHDGQRSGEPRRFDFGTPTSPVAPGYAQVTATTIYSSALGYGWLTSGVQQLDRGGTDPATRDLNYNSEMTFAVDLPNGTYSVAVTLGDIGNSHHDDVGVYVQGSQVDRVSTDAGQIVNQIYQNISITNGQLQVQLRDLGGTDPNAVIEALEVVRDDDPALAGWTVELHDQSGNVVASTRTASDGSYRLMPPSQATYQVVLKPWNGAAATYVFETLDGRSVFDTSGGPNGHNGTLMAGAAVGTPAEFGIADHPFGGTDNSVLRLNGETDFVNVLSSSDLEPALGAFSVSGWIRTSNVAGRRDIAGSYDAINGGGWKLELRPHPAGYSTKQSFASGTLPIAVATGDLNVDGKVDLVAANFLDNSLTIQLNDTSKGASSVSFTDSAAISTGQGPAGIAVGDVNGDGRDDLIYSNSLDNTVSVQLNLTVAGAQFPTLADPQIFPVGLGPTGITLADINNDGFLDIAVTNAGDDSVSVLLNLTAPGSTTSLFTEQQTFPVGFEPIAIAVGDFNGDQKVDIVAANSFFNNVSVLDNTTLANSQIASFAPKQNFTVGLGPSAIVSVDVNNDGRPDLVTINDQDRTVSVLLNEAAQGETSFSGAHTFSVGNDAIGLAADDLNGDGRPDLVVGNLIATSGQILYNKTPAGSASPTVSGPIAVPSDVGPIAIAIADFNADDAPDLSFANSLNGEMGGTVSVSLNRIDGSMLSVNLESDPQVEAGRLQVDDGTVLAMDTWYHVAFTYDPAADDAGDGTGVGTVKLYVNGELKTTAIGLGTLPSTPNVASASGISFNLGNSGGAIPIKPFAATLCSIFTRQLIGQVALVSCVRRV
ncbi:MAG: FG-GAP-like repeat-containing protein [bacterium]|nr:FG-GAP-like repeat-containing protein [bacterium]